MDVGPSGGALARQAQRAAVGGFSDGVVLAKPVFGGVVRRLLPPPDDGVHQHQIGRPELFRGRQASVGACGYLCGADGRIGGDGFAGVHKKVFPRGRGGGLAGGRLDAAAGALGA